MLFELAWRNLWRRPQRTALSLASLVLVSALLVFMLSFQIGVYETMKTATLRIFDGFAEIEAPGYADDPGLEHALSRPGETAAAARAVPGISAAAPRVNAFAILSSGARSYGAAVIGVDPGEEAKVSAIRRMVTQGRYLAPGDDDAAVLGEGLARNLGVAVGGRVTVLGAARDGSVAADVLRVVGVYRSGVPELDRAILETPLGRAQATFGMEDAATTIALGGPSLGGVNRALPDLRAKARAFGAVVADWGELEPAVRDSIVLKYAASMLFYLTLVAVVAFILLNTLLMSVLERTHEFGVLLAIGMRPEAVGRLVWIELFALALAGCGLGLVIGAGITLWFSWRGIVYPGLGDLLAQFGLPPRLYPNLNAASCLIGPGAIVAAVAIGGAAPYARVRRLTPAMALRSS